MEVSDENEALRQRLHDAVDAEFRRFLEPQRHSKVDKSAHLAENHVDTPPLANGHAHSHKKHKQLPVKAFIPRESPLTYLFQTSNLSVIYNLFLAILLLLVSGSFADDISEKGQPDLSFWLIWWCFGQFGTTMLIWATMFGGTIFIVYPAFHFWAHRTNNMKHGKNKRMYDMLFVGLYLIYIICMLYWPVVLIFKLNLPNASSFIVNCEAIRFLMKVHSFVRENVPRVLRMRRKDEGGKDDETIEIPGMLRSEMPCPRFERFLYFLWAPTLVYRDEYPRNKSRNWWLVSKYFVQCLGTIVYLNFVFTRFVLPKYREIDYTTVTLKTFVLNCSRSVLPGGFCLILLFWGLLHCWHNCFAEMLYFADRRFYAEWWNSKSMSAYYRDWNLVVHDWLFQYIYRDICLLVPRRISKAVAPMIVFFLSAFVHEFVFMSGIKMLYPVMFVLYFVFGGIFFFVSRAVKMDQAWNVLMWWNLLTGQGMFVALYSMEWYARRTCQPIYPDNWDVITPRSWFCEHNLGEVVN